MGGDRSTTSSTSTGKVRICRPNLIPFTLMALAVVVQLSYGVHINELEVPQEARNGTEDFVILDCDYSLNENEKMGLVVKWFFNKQPTPVYQWIHNQKPQDLGILRGRLDLDYLAGDGNDLSAHRALKIIRPTTELSGEYLCRVSTFEGDAYSAAKMTVYSPETGFNIEIESSPNSDTVNVSCWAQGVFPEPKLTIYYGPNEQFKLEEVEKERIFKESDGAFEVRVRKTIDVKELPDPTIFACELKIPNTSYVTRKETFYEVNGSPGQLGTRILLTFLLIIPWTCWNSWII